MSLKIRAILKNRIFIGFKMELGIFFGFLVNFDLLHIFAWPQQMLEGQDAMDSNASDPLQSGQRTNGITTTELDGNNALNHMQLKSKE